MDSAARFDAPGGSHLDPPVDFDADHQRTRPPPPPPVVAPPGPNEVLMRRPKVAGQLTPAWRMAFSIGWAVIVVCQAAVWETSRVIGLSTWWLGSDAQPRLVLVQLLPFYGPFLVTGASISNWRYVPYLGIAVAFVGAAIGLGDIDRVRWIAVVELVIAGAALCISVASLAGMYRKVSRPGPVS